jgi:hypothetical protein
MESIGIIIGAVLVGVFAVAIIVYLLAKTYASPKVSMETLDTRGLTAVEASYLLDYNHANRHGMLYSLLQKRAVWVESTNPC